MKNRILNIMVWILVAIGLASCGDDSSAGYTRITYYPVLTLEGDTYVYAPLNGKYEEPGYTAELDGKDVTSEVTVTSDVNTAKLGLYTVKYSIVNSDGIKVSSMRYVFFVNPADPVSGIYFTDPASYRIAAGKTQTYGKAYVVLVTHVSDNQYEVDELVGGWYAQRAGYGSDYALSGEIDVADNGEITLLESYVPGWGDSAESLDNATFDKVTGVISWKVAYAGMSFYVTMKKK